MLSTIDLCICWGKPRQETKLLYHFKRRGGKNQSQEAKQTSSKSIMPYS